MFWELSIVELSHKNRNLHNLRDDNNFFSEPHEVDLQWNLQISDYSFVGAPPGCHSRQAAPMLKSISLTDHCLPSTIQTIHVPLLVKAVGFTVEEISTRNNKVYTLLWNRNVRDQFQFVGLGGLDHDQDQKI
jgi:hypothetical protein